jgi:hypothetical protein
MRVTPALSVASLAFLACTGESPDTTCVASAIVGGTSESLLFGLSAQRTRAIVSLMLPAQNGPGFAICSGVVIAPGFVLTAKHCFDRNGDGAFDVPANEAAPTATLVLGDPTSATAPRGTLDAAWLHPTLDVALARADWLVTVADLEPIVINFATLDASWEGSPVELAGYGESEAATLGVLAFAIEEVSRIEQQFVVVDGRGVTGACVGDSGGPLLARTNDGSVRVVGVLDDGARGCTGEDFYTRTDVLATWNEFSSRVPSPPVAPIICEDVDGEGICVRGRAFWCDQGNVRVQDCGAGGNVCGWDVATSGFRCVPAANDACEGLGSFAVCSGNTVSTCVAGSLRHFNCETCMGTCSPWIDGRGAGCR